MKRIGSNKSIGSYKSFVEASSPIERYREKTRKSENKNNTEKTKLGSRKLKRIGKKSWLSAFKQTISWE